MTDPIVVAYKLPTVTLEALARRTLTGETVVTSWDRIVFDGKSLPGVDARFTKRLRRAASRVATIRLRASSREVLSGASLCAGFLDGLSRLDAGPREALRERDPGVT